MIRLYTDRADYEAACNISQYVGEQQHMFDTLESIEETWPGIKGVLLHGYTSQGEETPIGAYEDLICNVDEVEIHFGSMIVHPEGSELNRQFQFSKPQKDGNGEGEFYQLIDLLDEKTDFFERGQRDNDLPPDNSEPIYMFITATVQGYEHKRIFCGESEQVKEVREFLRGIPSIGPK